MASSVNFLKYLRNNNNFIQIPENRKEKKKESNGQLVLWGLDSITLKPDKDT